MAKWKLASEQLNLLSAGGEAAPVYDYIDGKRSDKQKVDPESGMPLWRQATILDDGSDDAVVKTVNIKYPAKEPVKVAKFHPFQVQGLELTVVGLEVGEYLDARSISVVAKK